MTFHNPARKSQDSIRKIGPLKNPFVKSARMCSSVRSWTVEEGRWMERVSAFEGYVCGLRRVRVWLER